MSERVGIRELKNNVSKIVRAVREEGVEYVVTLHGEPVAVLRPLAGEDLQLEEAEIESELAEMRTLAKEIAAAWTSEKTAVELVEEQRRG